MIKIWSVEYEELVDFIDASQKTSEGMIDMCRFDWGKSHKDRFKYIGGHHLDIDFSYSRAETGFVVRDAVFKNCIFDHSMWWLAEIHDCAFIKCSFNHCRFYNTILRSNFFDCTFDHMTARGEYFTFAWGNSYENCSFKSIEFRNVGDAIGTKFKNCIFSGKMSSTLPCTFYGWRTALKERFGDLPSVFSSLYWPVKFINCDLTDLKTKNITFEKDVVYKNTKGRPSELE